ncbi:MAG: MBL fold metallo-hydrolase [Candidatus Fermentibacteraceae bacterium]|nr:MBL fold metallo-hydrolase [Candidatus Fermentibacteraceae bacterium]
MVADRTGDNFFNFRFPEKEGFLYGFNLYALVSGNDVLLFDSAFRTQVTKVKKHLASEGLKLTHVVLTHFHNDHAAGLVSLKGDLTVLGSPEYRKTLKKNIPQTVTPVSFQSGYTFGDFKLGFTAAPGHSPCSIFIDINGRYLHAGDNLMGRYDGTAILPWVEFDQLENHISSLKMLRAMGRDRVLLSHGPELSGRKNINRAIDDRLSYLETVLDTGGKCSFEEAVSGCSCSFTGKEFFHDLLSR